MLTEEETFFVFALHQRLHSFDCAIIQRLYAASCESHAFWTVNQCLYFYGRMKTWTMTSQRCTNLRKTLKKTAVVYLSKLTCAMSGHLLSSWESNDVFERETTLPQRMDVIEMKDIDQEEGVFWVIGQTIQKKPEETLWKPLQLASISVISLKRSSTA